MTIQLKIKVQSDENGFFHVAEIQRNDQDLVFDDVKRKIPNEKYEDENATFEAQKEQIEANFAAMLIEFEKLNAEFVVKQT